ncbi:Chemotaxis protein methyltransferase CheR [hydrothermal vent metagenome]|uniref:protein-glutamate O-methyltransferase n=1 Tax=hydrothermal vent metagenome TaxID=652676 RepID=A0A3B0RQA6_9ZZZZ
MPALQKIREFEWRDQDYKFLSALLHEKTGIVLAEKKKEMMYGRLVRRLRLLKLNSFKDYCTYLQGPSGEKELGFALNSITTNTTSFFREKHHFDFLREEILPPIRREIDRNPGHHARIWSAGCSSGQEPYSIAMVMRDILGPRGTNSRILATDLDTAIIDTARAGRYDEKICQEACPKDAGHMTGGQMEIRSELKNMITFKQLNLLHDWPMTGKFDVIFCRNVMIYFDQETQDNLVRRFADRLKDGGFLFVGHSESLLNATDIFANIGKTTYRLLP